MIFGINGIHENNHIDVYAPIILLKTVPTSKPWVIKLTREPRIFELEISPMYNENVVKYMPRPKPLATRDTYIQLTEFVKIRHIEPIINGIPLHNTANFISKFSKNITLPIVPNARPIPIIDAIHDASNSVTGITKSSLISFAKYGDVYPPANPTTIDNKKNYNIYY